MEPPLGWQRQDPTFLGHFCFLRQSKHSADRTSYVFKQQARGLQGQGEAVAGRKELTPSSDKRRLACLAAELPR